MEERVAVAPQAEGRGLLRKATSFAFDGAKKGKEILLKSAPLPVKAGLEKIESNLWELDGKYPQVRDYFTKNGDSILAMVDTTIDAKLVGPAEKVISTVDGAVIKPSVHLLEEAKRVVDTTVVQPAVLGRKRADELFQEGLHLGKRVMQDMGIAENGQVEMSTALHAGSEKLKAAVSHPVETTIAVGQKTVDIVKPQVERLASEYVRPQVGRLTAPVSEFLGHFLDRADGVVDAYLPSSNDQEKFEDATGTVSVRRLVDTSSKVVRRTTRRVKELADSTLAEAKEAVPRAAAAAKDVVPRAAAAASVVTTQTAPIVEDLTKTAANVANAAASVAKGAMSVTLLTWLAAATVVFDRTASAVQTVKDTVAAARVTTLASDQAARVKDAVAVAVPTMTALRQRVVAAGPKGLIAGVMSTAGMAFGFVTAVPTQAAAAARPLIASTTTGIHRLLGFFRVSVSGAEVFPDTAHLPVSLPRVLAWFISAKKLISNAIGESGQSAAIAALTARDTAMLQFQSLASNEKVTKGLSTLSSLLVSPVLAIDRSRNLYNAIASHLVGDVASASLQEAIADVVTSSDMNIRSSSFERPVLLAFLPPLDSPAAATVLAVLAGAKDHFASAGSPALVLVHREADSIAIKALSEAGLGNFSRVHDISGRLSGCAYSRPAIASIHSALRAIEAYASSQTLPAPSHFRTFLVRNGRVTSAIL